MSTAYFSPSDRERLDEFTTKVLALCIEYGFKVVSEPLPSSLVRPERKFISRPAVVEHLLPGEGVMLAHPIICREPPHGNRRRHRTEGDMTDQPWLDDT